MHVCPRAFLTGQPEVVAKFRGSVIAMLDGSLVFDEVLEALDEVVFDGDTVAYIAAAEAAVNGAYANAVQAIGDGLIN